MKDTTTPTVEQQHMVMPVECGRYLWDDEPVTVYWQNDVLMGETSTECDKIEELDMIFRTENSMQHQITADAPWQRIGDCYKDGCESARHNVNDHSPIGAVGASKPESNSAAPIG